MTIVTIRGGFDEIFTMVIDSSGRRLGDSEDDASDRVVVVVDPIAAYGGWGDIWDWSDDCHICFMVGGEFEAVVG